MRLPSGEFLLTATIRTYSVKHSSRQIGTSSMVSSLPYFKRADNSTSEHLTSHAISDILHLSNQTTSLCLLLKSIKPDAFSIAYTLLCQNGLFPQTLKHCSHLVMCNLRHSRSRNLTVRGCHKVSALYMLIED